MCKNDVEGVKRSLNSFNCYSCYCTHVEMVAYVHNIDTFNAMSKGSKGSKESYEQICVCPLFQHNIIFRPFRHIIECIYIVHIM